MPTPFHNFHNLLHAKDMPDNYVLPDWEPRITRQEAAHKISLIEAPIYPIYHRSWTPEGGNLYYIGFIWIDKDGTHNIAPDIKGPIANMYLYGSTWVNAVGYIDRGCDTLSSKQAKLAILLGAI